MRTFTKAEKIAMAAYDLYQTSHQSLFYEILQGKADLIITEDQPDMYMATYRLSDRKFIQTLWPADYFEKLVISNDQITDQQDTAQ